MAADGETTARRLREAAASGDGWRLEGRCVDPRGGSGRRRDGAAAWRLAGDGVAARVARAEEERGRSFSVRAEESGHQVEGNDSSRYTSRWHYYRNFEQLPILLLAKLGQLSFSSPR